MRLGKAVVVRTQLAAANCSLRAVLASALVLLLLPGSVSFAQPQNLRDGPLFPKNPPPAVRVKALGIKGLSYTISGVPEYFWRYGCSPTAAGMIIGWWDAQTGCGNLFDGSAATWWGDATQGTQMMVASQGHIDAGHLLGFTYGSYQNHLANCLADFLHTQNSSTDRNNIGPGLVDFCAWAGPSPYKNVGYSATYTTNWEFNGWTYDEYCAEIDAGRPVHLGLSSAAGGHSVVGMGYDRTDGKQNYLCWTTWPGSWSGRVASWGWTGETQSGYNFYVYAGTYLRVTPKATSGPPSAPTAVAIAPIGPLTADNLVATASGSTNPDGAAITYDYQWAKSTDGGVTWSAWNWSGRSLSSTVTSKTESWKAQARANDGTHVSGWAASSPVTIANSPPTTPGAVTVAPTSPNTDDDLTATASGSTDPDSDTVSYEYQWARSTDGGNTWSGWDWSGAALDGALTNRGERWKVEARATDAFEAMAAARRDAARAPAPGIGQSAWLESTVVTIVNSAPAAPSAVTTGPASPSTDDNLTAAASGATDADSDTISYVYEWASSTDGGATWSAWGQAGVSLDQSLTTKGEQWKARGRAFDGTDYGPWLVSSPVTIGNTAPGAVSSLIFGLSTLGTDADVMVTPGAASDPDGDTLTYRCEWSKSADSGVTWTEWGNPGPTLDSSLTTKGDWWKARGRAFDGADYGPWLVSAPIQIENTAPSTPLSLEIAPSAPGTNDSLAALPGTTDDADGDQITYSCLWAKSADGGMTWSAWGHPGAQLDPSLTTKGEEWKSRTRAFDGTAYGPWVESEPVTIANTPPTAPPSVAIKPGHPLTDVALRPVVAAASDADGDPLTYRYRWSKSSDGGATWSAWTVAKIAPASWTRRGEQWRVACSSGDGSAWSRWCVSAPVTILNSRPLAPQTVTITPTSPAPGDALTATASGASDRDGETLTYAYEWRRSRDGGATWSRWACSGEQLSGSLTRGSVLWQVRARSSDGELASGWLQGAPVAVETARVSGALTVSAAAASTRSGQTVVAVALSQPGLVEVSIRNLAGRAVAVLPARALPSGVSNLLWNSRSANGTSVPGGMYLLAVTARTAAGLETRSLTTITVNR